MLVCVGVCYKRSNKCHACARHTQVSANKLLIDPRMPSQLVSQTIATRHSPLCANMCFLIFPAYLQVNWSIYCNTGRQLLARGRYLIADESINSQKHKCCSAPTMFTCRCAKHESPVLYCVEYWQLLRFHLQVSGPTVPMVLLVQHICRLYSAIGNC